MNKCRIEKTYRVCDGSMYNGNRMVGGLYPEDYMDVFEKKPSKGTAQNNLLLMIKLGLSEKYGDGPSTKYKVK